MILNTETDCDLFLHVALFFSYELIKTPGAFHQIPAPVIGKLKAGKMVVAPVHQPGLMQLLIPIPANAQYPQNVSIGILFYWIAAEIHYHPIQGTGRFYAIFKLIEVPTGLNGQTKQADALGLIRI